MASIGWIRDVRRSAWRRPADRQSARPSARPSAPPRRRLHPIVHRIVFGAFLWILFAAFVGFAGDGASSFLIGIAALLLAVYAAAPAILDRFRRYRDGKRNAGRVRDWADARIDTQAGPLTGRQALLQAVIGPVSLAVAMTALALVAGVVS